jgi:lipoprotein-anchoring transpeptidase ErfK/SrfK
MISGRLLHLNLAAVVILAFQAGCASFPSAKKEPPKPPRPPVSDAPASARKSYWNTEPVEGNPWIVIVLGEQRAYFFRDRTVVGESKISSGKKKFETPPGEYKVIQRKKDHVSNLYGKIYAADGSLMHSDADMSKHKVPEGGSFVGAKMPYFLRFHGGYGMHAGRVPDYPASHGCVRLPSAMAPRFFENAPLGTPVSVIREIPVDEAEQRKKERAQKAKPSWPWDPRKATGNTPERKRSTDAQRTQQGAVDSARHG